MNRKKTVLVAWAMVLGGTALVAGLVANSFADEAVVTEIEAPTEQSEVTIDLPQLDPSLKGVELATSAADSIEIKTSGPLVIASSTTRPLPGQSSDAFYTLDVLDQRSDLSEIVEMDGLEQIAEGVYWGTLGEPKHGSTEILSQVDGVAFTVIIGGHLSAKASLELVDGGSAKGAK